MFCLVHYHYDIPAPSNGFELTPFRNRVVGFLEGPGMSYRSCAEVCFLPGEYLGSRRTGKTWLMESLPHWHMFALSFFWKSFSRMPKDMLQINVNWIHSSMCPHTMWICLGVPGHDLPSGHLRMTSEDLFHDILRVLCFVIYCHVFINIIAWLNYDNY